jgi:hypothetical protein
MKKFLSLLLLLLLLLDVSQAFSGGRGGSVSVRGYTRKDGTYVQPHYRSAPDGSFSNNWSTKGNTNPYTGKEGTRVTPPDSGAYGGNYSGFSDHSKSLDTEGHDSKSEEIENEDK